MLLMSPNLDEVAVQHSPTFNLTSSDLSLFMSIIRVICKASLLLAAQNILRHSTRPQLEFSNSSHCNNVLLNILT